MFGTKKVECPRCLGKGNVTDEDIIRLNRELMWLPGVCAYCLGRGVASQKMVNNVSPSLTYLSLGITEAERKRIINKDYHALKRVERFEKDSALFKSQIKYLSVNGNMNAEEITEFFYLNEENEDLFYAEKKETLDFIDKVLKSV